MTAAEGRLSELFQRMTWTFRNYRGKERLTFRENRTPTQLADKGGGVMMARMVVQMWIMIDQSRMVQRAGGIVLGDGMRIVSP